EGGHRKHEVASFVKKHRRLYTYKGENRGSEKFRRSKNHKDLILFREKEYKSSLLYYIYIQDKKDNYYWYLLPDNEITDDYVREIAALRPDSSNKKEGNMFENYVHNNRMHDYFDTSKMYLALEDFAVAKLKKHHWLQKKAEILGIKSLSPENNVQPQVRPKSNWMTGYV
ncbi:MAG: hypothetical protein GY730_10150, partial [bacterium]|nr:hypothetical protein [bacterium]